MELVEVVVSGFSDSKNGWLQTLRGLKIRRLKPQRAGYFLRADQQSESFPRVDAAHHPLMRISLLILLRKLPFPSFV